MGLHPSHVTRSSDASTFDIICVNCGAHDSVPGGWGNLATPCPKAGDTRPDEIDRLRSELATSEASCDRLRSSYDDIRALNVQIIINCATERAAKDARIAELEEQSRFWNLAQSRANARAEKAEARVAELEPLEHSFETILEAKCLEVSKRLISRAEKAEASHEQQVIVAANYAELAEKAEAELVGVKSLLMDKTYIQCKADYNRGHLSHANYLNEREHAALQSFNINDQKFSDFGNVK